MSGLYLASLADFSDKIALTGNIAGGGYGSFTCDFATDAGGDVTLYLLDSQNNVLLGGSDLRKDGLAIGW